MRSYLIDHETEFKNSLGNFERHNVRGIIEGIAKTSGGVGCDVSLLYRWTYQVLFYSFIISVGF